MHDEEPLPAAAPMRSSTAYSFPAKFIAASSGIEAAAAAPGTQQCEIAGASIEHPDRAVEAVNLRIAAVVTGAAGVEVDAQDLRVGLAVAGAAGSVLRTVARPISRTAAAASAHRQRQARESITENRRYRAETAAQKSIVNLLIAEAIIKSVATTSANLIAIIQINNSRLNDHSVNVL